MKKKKGNIKKRKWERKGKRVEIEYKKKRKKGSANESLVNEKQERNKYVRKGKER